MILCDVNILVHAFRSDSSDHGQCHPWLERLVGGQAQYGLSPLVLSGFVRVVTHPRVFKVPSRLAEALDYCDGLLAQPNCVVVEPGAAHWRIFVRLCLDADARGNLVPDAWIAALAIEWSCELVTLDRDYRRFPGLKCRQPG